MIVNRMHTYLDGVEELMALYYNINTYLCSCTSSNVLHFKLFFLWRIFATFVFISVTGPRSMRPRPHHRFACRLGAGIQREVQPGEQLLQSTLEVWKGPSMIITGDDDPTIPTQVIFIVGYLLPPKFGFPSLVFRLALGGGSTRHARLCTAY